MSNQVTDWSKPQRQSASALIILLFKAFFSLLKVLWPLLIVLILNKKGNSANGYEYFALGISVLSLLRSAIEYYNFRFSITGNNLVIKSGLFTKKTIVLPLDKIQAVHAEQTWLHSLFNVSRLSFDSAGSEKTEVRIEALDKLRTTALKEFILPNKSETTAVENKTRPEKEETLITLAGNDILKLGLSSNHIEAFFLIAAFIYSTLSSAGMSDKELAGGAKWVYDNFGKSSINLALFLAMAVLLISISVSIIKILLTYSDFVISRSAGGYRIKSGLITKKEKFVPFKKIQFISWKANWVRQKIGLFLLQFHAVGNDQIRAKMQIKVPVTRKSFIPLLLKEYHSLLPVAAIPAIHVHKAYIFRRALVFGILPSLILFPFLFSYFQFNSLLILLLAGFVGLSAFLFQKKFRLWIDKEALQIKKGEWGRHELILKWNNIQSILIKQSVYQRKQELATLCLNTAGGKITIPYIQLQQAREIQNYCLYKIESSYENWY